MKVKFMSVESLLLFTKELISNISGLEQFGLNYYCGRKEAQDVLSFPKTPDEKSLLVKEKGDFYNIKSTLR